MKLLKVFKERKVKKKSMVDLNVNAVSSVLEQTVDIEIEDMAWKDIQ